MRLRSISPEGLPNAGGVPRATRDASPFRGPPAVDRGDRPDGCTARVPRALLVSSTGHNNDFFVNLLDLDTEWRPTSGAAETFEGRSRSW
jgi:hypothetical protein